MSKPNIEIYPEIEDYRKLMDWVSERFKDNIAYKYRENREDKNSAIIEKTYETVVRINKKHHPVRVVLVYIYYFK